MHVFIALMALSGAALFETGLVRYSTVAVTIAMIAMIAMRSKIRKRAR